MNTIGSRVRDALRGSGVRQKDLADQIGMSPDALSRSLNDQRGFAAIELAEIARRLKVDVNYLITGETDSQRLVFSARHSYEEASGRRRVNGLESDTQVLENIRLAYIQALA